MLKESGINCRSHGGEENLDFLWKMPPTVEAILNIQPENVEDKHLASLDKHLVDLCCDFPNLAEAIWEIRGKIAILTSRRSLDDIRQEMQKVA